MALLHAAPGEPVHLPTISSIPADARSSALVKTDRFEAAVLLVRAGTSIAPHAVVGYCTLQCLEGLVTLETGEAEIELKGGDWVYLERGERHGVTAAEDSTLLLTILFD